MGDIGHALRPNYEKAHCCGNCHHATENAREDGTVDCHKIHEQPVSGDHPDADMVCAWWKRPEPKQVA